MHCWTSDPWHWHYQSNDCFRYLPPTSSLLDHPQCLVDCLPWRGRTFLSWASMMMGWKSGEARMWRYHSVWVTQLCTDCGCGYENCFACSGLVAVLCMLTVAQVCNKLMQLFQFGSVSKTSSVLWNHHVRNIQVEFGFGLKPFPCQSIVDVAAASFCW